MVSPINVGVYTTCINNNDHFCPRKLKLSCCFGTSSGSDEEENIEKKEIEDLEFNNNEIVENKDEKG